MDTNVVASFLTVIICIYIFGRLFIVPLKIVLKIILNSIIGTLGLFVINLSSGIFGFHIGINIFTMLFVGLLGIPGTILLIILKQIF